MSLCLLLCLLLQPAAANTELHNNLFGLQRGPHQRVAAQARRLGAAGPSPTFDDLFEHHSFEFTGPYPGKGFLEHRHSVVFRQGTSFLGDWTDLISPTVECVRGGYLGGRAHRARRAANEEGFAPPLVPGEDARFHDLPSVALHLTLLPSPPSLVADFLAAMDATKVLILDAHHLDSSPTCQAVLDIRLGGNNFSPIFRVLQASLQAGGSSSGNVTLLAEPGALLEPFLSASWSSNHTPNWEFALANRSETLGDYTDVLLDIASSQEGRRALAGDPGQCAAWKAAAQAKLRQRSWPQTKDWIREHIATIGTLPCTNAATLGAPITLPGINVNYNDATGRADTLSVPIYVKDSTVGEGDVKINISASVTCENCYLYYNHTLSIGLEFCAWGHFSFGIFGTLGIDPPSVFKGCLQMDLEDNWLALARLKALQGFANYHLWLFARYVANFGAGATVKVGLNITGEGTVRKTIWEPKASNLPTPTLGATPSSTKSSVPSPSASKGAKIALDDQGSALLSAYSSAKNAFEKAKAAAELVKKYKGQLDALRQPPGQKPASKALPGPKGKVFATMIGPVPVYLQIIPGADLVLTFAGGVQFKFLYGSYFAFSMDTGFEYTAVGSRNYASTYAGWNRDDDDGAVQALYRASGAPLHPLNEDGSTGLRTWKTVLQSTHTIGPDMSLKILPSMLRLEVQPFLKFSFYGFVNLTFRLPLRFQGDLGWYAPDAVACDMPDCLQRSILANLPAESQVQPLYITFQQRASLVLERCTLKGMVDGMFFALNYVGVKEGVTIIPQSVQSLIGKVQGFLGFDSIVLWELQKLFDLPLTRRILVYATCVPTYFSITTPPTRSLGEGQEGQEGQEQERPHFYIAHTPATHAHTSAHTLAYQPQHSDPGHSSHPAAAHLHSLDVQGIEAEYRQHAVDLGLALPEPEPEAAAEAAAAAPAPAPAPAAAPPRRLSAATALYNLTLYKAPCTGRAAGGCTNAGGADVSANSLNLAEVAAYASATEAAAAAFSTASNLALGAAVTTDAGGWYAGSPASNCLDGSLSTVCASYDDAAASHALHIPLPSLPTDLCLYPRRDSDATAGRLANVSLLLHEAGSGTLLWSGATGAAIVPSSWVCFAVSAASPSTTGSATPSPSATPSLTPTGSGTASGTASTGGSPQPTPSPSPSPSPSASPTPTSSPSRTPTVPASPSRSPSRTLTPSRSPSRTRTPSPTVTRSGSRTPSNTPSNSRTPSTTRTFLPSAAPSCDYSVPSEVTPGDGRDGTYEVSFLYIQSLATRRRLAPQQQQQQQQQQRGLFDYLTEDPSLSNDTAFFDTAPGDPEDWLASVSSSPILNASSVERAGNALDDPEAPRNIYRVAAQGSTVVRLAGVALPSNATQLAFLTGSLTATMQVAAQQLNVSLGELGVEGANASQPLPVLLVPVTVSLAAAVRGYSLLPPNLTQSPDDLTLVADAQQLMVNTVANALEALAAFATDTRDTRAISIRCPAVWPPSMVRYYTAMCTPGLEPLGDAAVYASSDSANKSTLLAAAVAAGVNVSAASAAAAAAEAAAALSDDPAAAFTQRVPAGPPGAGSTYRGMAMALETSVVQLSPKEVSAALQVSADNVTAVVPPLSAADISVTTVSFVYYPNATSNASAANATTPQPEGASASTPPGVLVGAILGSLAGAALLATAANGLYRHYYQQPPSAGKATVTPAATTDTLPVPAEGRAPVQGAGQAAAPATIMLPGGVETSVVMGKDGLTLRID